MRRISLLALGSLFLFCANANRERAALNKPPPPLPRSSIAAVLAARGELNLTVEQLGQLEKMDEQLEKANAPIRSEIQRLTQGGVTSNPAAGSTGRRAGGAGSRRRGEPGAGSPRTGRGAPGTLQERIDDNDTQAYLQAESVLTPEQQPRAREIASRFREELWDRRHGNGKPNATQ
ncbi:MAG TPA: hypothetical protein VN918_11480 [Myxococcaceae bacterium]|nr:hypothetical protein [Myxococcaceae bacterium]